LFFHGLESPAEETRAASIVDRCVGKQVRTSTCGIHSQLVNPSEPPCSATPSGRFPQLPKGRPLTVRKKLSFQLVATSLGKTAMPVAWRKQPSGMMIALSMIQGCRCPTQLQNKHAEATHSIKAILPTFSRHRWLGIQPSIGKQKKMGETKHVQSVLHSAHAMFPYCLEVYHL